MECKVPGVCVCARVRVCICVRVCFGGFGGGRGFSYFPLVVVQKNAACIIPGLIRILSVCTLNRPVIETLQDLDIVIQWLTGPPIFRPDSPLLATTPSLSVQPGSHTAKQNVSILIHFTQFNSISFV